MGKECCMNLLFLGDVVGSAGCEAVQRFLPQLKRQYAADLTIVNGENSADGNGIHRPSAQALLDAAGYVTEMVKRKHPFDQGTPAREGIEF